MIDYKLSWIFYFQYNHKNASATAFFSKKYQEEFSFDQPLYVFDQEKLKVFVHKYDYRKLGYFAENQLKGYFDTLLRFKIENQKGYLRTQAVCHPTKQGFSCMIFNERDVVKMQHQIGKTKIFPSASSMNIMNPDEIQEINQSTHISQIKRQIVDLLERN